MNIVAVFTWHGYQDTGTYPMNSLLEKLSMLLSVLIVEARSPLQYLDVASVMIQHR